MVSFNAPGPLSAQTQKFGISMKNGFIGRPLSVVLVIGAAMNNPNYYFCQFLMKVTLQLL